MMRGLNAPPRSTCAPASFTACAVSTNLLALSTAHGPAMMTICGPPILTPSSDDDRILRMHVARRHLERLQDRHGFLDAVQHLEVRAIDRAIVADHADDGALFTCREMHAIAQRFHARHDAAKLVLHWRLSS